MNLNEIVLVKSWSNTVWPAPYAQICRASMGEIVQPSVDEYRI